MKKKTLFSLLMASTLVVGCQQDELVSIENEASVNLGNRPELGSVVLNGVEAETRLALNTNNKYSFKWEEGDKLGAAIVDTVNLTASITGYGKDKNNTWKYAAYTYADYAQNVVKSFGTYPKNNYYKFTQTYNNTSDDRVLHTSEEFYVVNKNSIIASNYPYELKDGKWTTQANLVEGNYVFYAPYDRAHLTRQPLVITLPVEQDCSSESKAVTDFYAGSTPVTLGTAFLAAPEDRSQVIYPSVKMTNIFAYPQITIKNNFKGFLFNGDAADSNGKYWSSATSASYTMKLKKIEIYDAANNATTLDYKRALDAPAYKAAVAAGWDADKKADGTGIFTTGKTSEILAATGSYNRATYFYTKTNAIRYENYGTKYADGAGNDIISEYYQKHVCCDLGGKELKSGEEYKFFVVMPAEDYGNEFYAKITVEINGKDYIILQNPAANFNGDATTGDVAGLQDDNELANFGKAYITDVTTALKDYNFRDVKHGDQGVRLVRGQRYPAAEVLEDASAVKSFAGTLLTINLTGGLNQIAVAKAEEVITTDRGITSNADFINHITMNVQRGVSLVENTAVQTKSRDDWDATDIAFADENTVVINAELVKALYSRLYDERNGVATGDTLTLNATYLPIASDVKVAKTATAKAYKFTTNDGVSYVIKFMGALEHSSTDGKLFNGINILTATNTLALDNTNGTVTGAVVFVEASVAATMNGATGIAAVTVEATGSLTVNCSTAARIINAGVVTVGQNGALTNADNELDGTVENNYLKQIAGTVKSTGVVSANFIAWPTTTIPANARINKMNVNLGTAGALTINQAEVDKLANLSKVVVELGTNVTSIASSSSVDLTASMKSMKSLVSAGIEWTTTASAITVKCGKATYTDFFTKVTPGTGVTFIK